MTGEERRGRKGWKDSLWSCGKERETATERERERERESEREKERHTEEVKSEFQMERGGRESIA